MTGVGDILRLQDDLPEARARLLEALRHATERESKWEIGRCHTSLGVVASEGGDLAAVAHHLDQAIELLRVESHREALSRAYRTGRRWRTWMVRRKSPVHVWRGR